MDKILKITEDVISIIKNDIGWEDNGIQINNETKLFEDLELDSVMIVQLIVDIEEKFKVIFDDSEELISSLNSVDSLVTFIIKNQAGI